MYVRILHVGSISCFEIRSAPQNPGMQALSVGHVETYNTYYIIDTYMCVYI